MRSFAHSNCVNFNQAALRAVLKLGNMSQAHKQKKSFQSLFGSLFSVVSIAVWIYFNRLQYTGVKLFRIWKTCNRVHKQHEYPYIRFVRVYASVQASSICFLLPPFPIVSESLFGSLFSIVSVTVWIYFNRLQNTGAVELHFLASDPWVVLKVPLIIYIYLLSLWIIPQ